MSVELAEATVADTETAERLQWQTDAIKEIGANWDAAEAEVAKTQSYIIRHRDYEAIKAVQSYCYVLGIGGDVIDYSTGGMLVFKPSLAHMLSKPMADALIYRLVECGAAFHRYLGRVVLYV